MNYLSDFNQYITESKKPNIKKMEIDGFVVYQGRDADANDHLTFELSSPEDLWFHAKGEESSNVK